MEAERRQGQEIGITMELRARYKFDPDACKPHGLLLPQGKHGGENLNRARHPIAMAVRMHHEGGRL